MFSWVMSGYEPNFDAFIPAKSRHFLHRNSDAQIKINLNGTFVFNIQEVNINEKCSAVIPTFFASN